MAGEVRRVCARAASWWIVRNPTYLLSAATMAVGARLYLHAPDARTGDVGLMLLTLGILQAYELAVSGVLIALYRFKRCTADRPSLLLVAALFWTGPLVATLELAEEFGTLGVGFSAAACAVAWLVLRVVKRVVGLQLSPSGQMAAGFCLVLLVAAQLRLHVPPDADGTDEAGLYACWWLLAVLMLFAIPAMRWHSRAASDGSAGLSGALRVEVAFLAVLSGEAV